MTRWPTILILFAALLLRADEPADKLTLAGIKEFTVAYQKWDGEDFAKAEGLFYEALKAAPNSSASFYWLSVAQFHKALLLRSLRGFRLNRESAEAALDVALTTLESAVKLNERDPELHALLGTAYGIKIDDSLMRGMRFGPRLTKHLKRAMELGPKNPRVWYLVGTCQFHTAKTSQSQRETLATLLKAEQLFYAEQQAPAGPLQPHWGLDSCQTFLGQTYEVLGEPDKAAEYFRKALVLHPSHYLAKEGLERVSKVK